MPVNTVSNPVAVNATTHSPRALLVEELNDEVLVVRIHFRPAFVLRDDGTRYLVHLVVFIDDAGPPWKSIYRGSVSEQRHELRTY